jgi:hypothetical protein
LRLKPVVVRESFKKLQTFHNIRPNLSREQAAQHAAKIFFLSFNIIPVIETSGNKDELRDFRERYLVTFLEYFRNVTIHVNFGQDEERQFFDHVVDLLFGDVEKYRNFNIVKKFNDRISIFDTFIRSHNYYGTKRNDWLYLYCLIYKYSPYHRPLLSGTQLANYAQRLSMIPYSQASGIYSDGGLKDTLKQTQYFYYQCSGDRNFFMLNFAELPDLAHEIYILKLDEEKTEAIAELLSWLPSNFEVPIHLTVREVAPFVSHLLNLNTRGFKQIGYQVNNALSTMPRGSQLDILKHMVANSIIK